MSDVAAFNKQLDQFLRKAEIDAVTFQKRVAFEVFRGVIQKTPVDTGWAQNNWNISVGQVDLSVTPRPEGSAGSLDALRKMEDVRVRDIGEVIYISNNLSYIRYLEEGSSKRAPNGMVKVTVGDIQAQVNSLLEG